MMTGIGLIVEFAGVVALAMLLRAYGVWINRRYVFAGTRGDDTVHKMLIRYVKERSSFDYIEQFSIREEPVSYPRAFHRFCALFPMKWLDRWPFLPNLVIFAATSGVFFLFSLELARHHIPDVSPERFAFWATALFLLAPSNLMFDGPAIAYLMLSERLLGRLSTSACFLGLTLGLVSGAPVAYAGAVVAGGLAGVSAIFARQVLWFGLPLVALFLWRVEPLGVLAGATLVSLVLSGRYFLRGVRLTVLHWITYVTHTRHSSIVKQAVSRFSNPRVLFGPGVPLAQRLREFERGEPGRALLRYPDVFLLVAIGLSGGAVPGEVMAVLLACLTLWVATSTPMLNFIGESYRYLEYGASLIAPLFLTSVALQGDAGPWILGVFLIMTVPYAVWAMGRLCWGAQAGYQRALRDMVERVGLGPDDSVFQIPMRLGPELTLLAPCKVLWWQPGSISPAIFDRYVGEYPFLRADWDAIFKQHGITKVIVNRPYLSAISWRYDFSALEPIYDDGEFAVFRVPTVERQGPSDEGERQ